MKKIFVFLLFPAMLISCDQKTLQSALDVLAVPLTNDDIASGLKEALNHGVDESVKKLSATDGYYKSVYKIVLPDEAEKVVDKLKVIPGFKDVEEVAIEKINRAAEDAASKAGPIFLDAIKGMSFDDAMNILMGEKNAATTYLHNKTYQALYDEFRPVIINSLNKFGALDYWESAVSKYNSIPLLKDVNPDLADHVATKALVGLFDQVEQKEYGIRTDVGQRTTDLLKKVFQKQD